MDPSFSPKDEIWFLRVYHHISNAIYSLFMWLIERDQNVQFPEDVHLGVAISKFYYYSTSAAGMVTSFIV
jgi:hypothetical protein